MIELHGWLFVSETFEDEDLLPQTELASREQQIRNIIAENRCGISLQYVNGLPFLNTLYCANHRTDAVNEIIDTYRRIAEAGTGSYGVIYLRDDEDPVHYNEFQVWVFKKGSCSRKTDTDFSPCIPTVEDGFVMP